MKQKTTDFQKFPASKPAVAPVNATKSSGKLAINVVPKSEIENCPFRGLIDEWLDYCRVNLSPETIEDYQSKVYKFWWWWSEYSHYSETLGAHPKNVYSITFKRFISGNLYTM